MTSQPERADTTAAPTYLDRLGRPLRDLRISVTDRCNFRCVYCMPKEVFGHDHAFLPHSQVLTFEEITRIARAAVGLGVEKLRITGGEPLVRRDIERLRESAARLGDEFSAANGADRCIEAMEALFD